MSLFPKDGDDTGSLLRNAEAAMLESKKGGHAYVVSNRARAGLLSEAPFRDQATEGGGEPALGAPTTSRSSKLATGRMHGVEALIRWMEPDGTMVPPSFSSPSPRSSV